MLDAIRAFAPDLVAVRHDLHAHPELGLETPRTAAVVADRLRAYGADAVATGIGGHGVVATIRGSGDGPAIGFRADMDALPIEETAEGPVRSTVSGRMHACGHDGHTAMLLGAVRQLAATRRFGGTVHAIFQPGEEGAGGAEAMLADGLFARFPCEAVYGLHNRPNLALGAFSIGPGAFMAGGAFFDIRVDGAGAHAAHPDHGLDPVPVAAAIVTAAQTIVSRRIAALTPAVLSITRLEAGSAYNVIPSTATLSGTARALDGATLASLGRLLAETAAGVASAHGLRAALDWRVLFAPLVNHPVHAAAMADAAADLVGDDGVRRDAPPTMGSEDFSFMLERVPGAYIELGIGPSAPLHNPAYRFDDRAIPFGAALFARLAERHGTVRTG